MKIAAYLLLLLAIFSCRRGKDVDPKAFQLIKGMWEQTGHQTKQNGEKVWVKDSTSGKVSLIIRADGVPLDKNGDGFCCSPENYLLNGKLYPIELGTPVVKAGFCINSLCASCETVELQVTKTDMLWNYCDVYQATYRRLP